MRCWLYLFACNLMWALQFTCVGGKSAQCAASDPGPIAVRQPQATGRRPVHLRELIEFSGKVLEAQIDAHRDAYMRGVLLDELPRHGVLRRNAGLHQTNSHP